MVTVLIIWSVTDLVVGSPKCNRFARPILRRGVGPILVTSTQIYLNAIWRPNILETICSHFLSPSLVQSLLRAPTGLDGKDDLYFRHADCVIIGDCMANLYGRHTISGKLSFTFALLYLHFCKYHVPQHCKLWDPVWDILQLMTRSSWSHSPRNFGHFSEKFLGHSVLDRLFADSPFTPTISQRITAEDDFQQKKLRSMANSEVVNPMHRIVFQLHFWGQGQQSSTKEAISVVMNRANGRGKKYQK